VQEEIREIIRRADGLFLDFFGVFLGPLEQELKVNSSKTQGKAMAWLTWSPTRCGSMPPICIVQ